MARGDDVRACSCKIVNALEKHVSYGKDDRDIDVLDLPRRVQFTRSGQL